MCSTPPFSLISIAGGYSLGGQTASHPAQGFQKFGAVGRREFLFDRRAGLLWLDGSSVKYFLYNDIDYKGDSQFDS
jgi:hypothetical protein